jgi:mycothiol synthase
MTITASGPSDAAPAAIIRRPYRFEADFWRVRALLVETYPITGLGFNWEIRRWDGRHFHNADLSMDAFGGAIVGNISDIPGSQAWRDRCAVWETADGRIVGAAHPESEGEAHLQIHPDFREAIEAEMIAWAAEHCAVPDDEGRSGVQFFVYDYDAPRRRLLEEQGFEQMPWTGVHRRMFLGQRPLPVPHLAEGYTLRTVGADRPEDGERIAALLNAAFNRTIHTGLDFTHFARYAPCFREDLHLVAEAPDGSFAAHVGVNYDEPNRRALYEPVCTHPDHRQKGLAQALMHEGLRRITALGAVAVTVETGDAVPANRLYESLGFTEAYLGHTWRRLG